MTGSLGEHVPSLLLLLLLSSASHRLLLAQYRLISLLVNFILFLLEKQDLLLHSENGFVLVVFLLYECLVLRDLLSELLLKQLNSALVLAFDGGIWVLFDLDC